MKRLALNINKVVNKLYSTIPLVPSNGLMQNIYQDIQYGLYDNCGDPNKNWDRWKERCIELLKQRRILGKALLDKKAFHDYNSRSHAGIYIDGEFYEAESHNEALELYLKDSDLNRQHSLDPEIDVDRSQVIKELNKNDDINDLPFACFHIINDLNYSWLVENYIRDENLDENDYEKELNATQNMDAIFIEKDTLKNININDLINAIKDIYYGYQVFIDNSNSDPFKYEQYEKIARLKKRAYHDVHDRDSAILYIDNNFFENNTHNEALTDYTNSINIRRRTNPSSISREVFEDEFYNNKKLEDVDYCCLNKVTYDPIENEDVKRIFIDINTLKNIDLNSLISKIKSQYPNFEIYIDNDNVGAHDIDKYERAATKKNKRLLSKTANKIYLEDILSEDSTDSYGYNTDYGNRAFAISYIDGEIFEGEVHKDTIGEYLNENNYEADELLDYSEGFVTNEEQDNIDIPMAFASYINGIDGNDYVCIYPGTLYYVELYELKEALQEKYPSAIICVDNNDRYDHGEKGYYIETI